jgi:hypothetical protein
VTAYWRTSAEAAALAAWAVLAPAALAAQGTNDLPPAGLGTLRQDAVAVRITTDNLTVRALPLDERVIRLLSPDTYAGLHQLVVSRTNDIGKAARAAGRDSALAVMVTFFALQPQVTFTPDQLSIAAQNNFYRPLGIIPLTPRWSEYRIDQRQQASAIFLFDAAIPVLQPFTLFYGALSSDAWEGSLSQLESERARVLARAAQRQQP